MALIFGTMLVNAEPQAVSPHSESHGGSGSGSGLISERGIWENIQIRAVFYWNMAIQWIEGIGKNEI